MGRMRRVATARWVLLIAVLVATLAVAACSDSEEPAAGSSAAASDQPFPDVVDVMVTQSGDAYDFAVTISSPYDSPERYADAWRVLAPDGTVLGERVLLHDHANEQPFTRSLSGVEIPAEVQVVTIQGRDLVNGYGGGDAQVALPGRG